MMMRSYWDRKWQRIKVIGLKNERKEMEMKTC